MNSGLRGAETVLQDSLITGVGSDASSEAIMPSSSEEWMNQHSLIGFPGAKLMAF